MIVADFEVAILPYISILRSDLLLFFCHKLNVCLYAQIHPDFGVKYFVPLHIFTQAMSPHSVNNHVLSVINESNENYVKRG